ncbi:MAG TPA: type 2 lanthipeptide synthetase LanM, partial [Blastocatellia bacterium]|nr:type 2 lanthipeptide synthetase LanM [Blastocatellia bacterium]
ITSSTGRVIPDVLEQSGIELARERVKGLGVDDLSRQVWFIRSAMTALSMEGAEDYRAPARPTRREPKREAGRDRLIAAARAVAERLRSIALESADGEISWVGLGLVGDRHWTLATAGLDLYSGLPGIGLFFGYLASVTGDERYMKTARAVAGTIVRQLRLAKWPADPPIGAFGPMAGSAYFLTHMGHLWGDEELLIVAEDLLLRVPPAIGGDKYVDIISGVAGCIPVLLAQNRVRGCDGLVAAAVNCGDHLISHAAQANSGLGWKTVSNSSGPLTGFSHGAAGIAWALLELYAVTLQDRFRDTALAGLEYERGLFCVEESNWPDLRVFVDRPAPHADGPSFMTAWCHGAAGIGIARAKMLTHLRGSIHSSELEEEVRAAVSATLAHGFGSNHCLCHGALGNIELLLLASQELGDTRLKLETYRAAAAVLDNISETGWLCGVPAGVETPGLMTGLAGIGYELLRLAEPDNLPSVLVLSSPTI